MRNIRIEIEYTGKDHHGWQVQKNRRTIQGDIQKVIKKVLQEDIEIIGSGRTDAKVSARKQVANFYTKSSLSVENMYKAFNSNLPKSIVILKVEDVEKDFHARFNAKKKTYIYTIATKPTALMADYVYFYDKKLNLQLMNEAIKKFIGVHDFKAFKSSKGAKKTTVREIYDANVYFDKANKNNICIKITGNGFLYNMVRIISGTILEVGEGKRDISTIEKLLQDGKREEAGRTLPAEGLMLYDVEY